MTFYFLSSCNEDDNFVYYGDTCQHKREKLAWESKYIIAAAAGCGGALILIIFVTCCLCYRKKKNENKSSKQYFKNT